MTTRIANAAAAAAVNSVVDLLDGGAGAGYIEIRTGAQPASVGTAASGTLLGTLTLSDPAFGNATSANPAVARPASSAWRSPSPPRSVPAGSVPLTRRRCSRPTPTRRRTGASRCSSPPWSPPRCASSSSWPST